eukprot:gb/GEZN01003558.1/.p1 GENE.gb/GEZN01003558.1/~~gb/GEZN01003558.1/.p1  ORF type:complete len:664 (-),score=147.62 gb/GEZN01003558.1/:27-2018(-)
MSSKAMRMLGLNQQQIKAAEQLERVRQANEADQTTIASIDSSAKANLDVSDTSARTRTISSKALKMLGLKESSDSSLANPPSSSSPPLLHSTISLPPSSSSALSLPANSLTSLTSSASSVSSSSTLSSSLTSDISAQEELERKLNLAFPTLVCLRAELLQKLGTRRLLKSMTPKWQKRLVVLEPKGLKYMSMGVTGKLDLRGEMVFTTASKCEQDRELDEPVFKLVPHPGSRAYHFRCENITHLHSWLDAINATIAGSKDLELEHARIVKLFTHLHPGYPRWTRSGLLATYHPAINSWKTRLVTLDRQGVRIWSTEKLTPKGFTEFTWRTAVTGITYGARPFVLSISNPSAADQPEAPARLLACLDKPMLVEWLTSIKAEVATILPDLSQQTHRRALTGSHSSSNPRKGVPGFPSHDKSMDIRLAEVKLKQKLRAKFPSNPVPIYEGLLHKTDSKMRKWNKRYVLLFPDKLTYHDPTSLVQKGEVPLTSESIVNLQLDQTEVQRQYCFSVAVQKGWRTYLFSADGELKAQQWVRAIQDAAAELPTVSSLAEMVSDKNKHTVQVRKEGRGGAKRQLQNDRAARRKRDRMMTAIAMPSPMQLPKDMLSAMLTAGHQDALEVVALALRQDLREVALSSEPTEITLFLNQEGANTKEKKERIKKDIK